MINYNVLFFILGLFYIISAWLPTKLIRRPLSLPMIWLALGIFLSIFDPGLPDIDFITNSELTERLTEFALILSLLGAGLKIDRSMGWRSWLDTWRLLIIAMPLTILFMMLGSYYLLPIPWIIALLLGASIAPTDPVLASDIQVGPPGQGKEHAVRFALTSESGFNDGLAFPFVNLALLLIVSHADAQLLTKWLLLDVLWKTGIGLTAGTLIGHIIARFVLKPPRVMPINDEFIAIALALLAYGSTELIHGYGFLGVFMAAYVFRHYDHSHQFHQTLYNFSKQIERLLIPLLLVLLGIFIQQGIFTHLTWREVLLAVVFLVIIRPLSGFISLLGSKTSHYHKLIIAIFGIRGVGSFYYLAYAQNHNALFHPYAQQLWRVVSLIVFLSIVFHGMSASLVFQRLTRSEGKTT